MSRMLAVYVSICICLLAVGCGQKGEKLTTRSKQAREEYQLGMAASDKLYFEEAVEHFQRAVEHDSQFAMAYSRLSHSLQLIGDESKAREAEKMALKHSKDEHGDVRVTEKEQIFIALQDAYLSDDHPRVQTLIERWVEQFPQDYEAYAFLGQEHQRVDENEQAMAVFRKAVELNPDYAQAYNSLGYLYLGQGDFEKAREYLEKYRQAVPDQANPYDSIGELEQARGNYKEALKHYQKAYQMNPDLHYVLHHLGEVHAIQGQYDRAIDYYLEAAEKAAGPEAEAAARQQMAYLYMRRGDLKQALTEARRAVELDPEYPGTHYYLGLVHLALGDVNAAMEDADHINRLLDKRNLRRFRMDRYFYHLMGEIHLARREHDIAIDSHRRAVDLTPNPLYRNYYLQALGNAYYRAGKLDQATEVLEQALHQNPKHSDCLLTLIHVFQEKGDQKRAKEMFDRLKEVLEDADEGVEWVEKARGLKL